VEQGFFFLLLMEGRLVPHLLLPRHRGEKRTFDALRSNMFAYHQMQLSRASIASKRILGAIWSNYSLISFGGCK